MNALELLSVKAKNIIVTGGGHKSQFGACITRGLVEAGANVIITSRKINTQKEFKASLEKEGYTIDVFELDLDSSDSIETFVADVYKKYKIIDVLVNNAVTRIMQDPDDFENFSKSLHINLSGTYHLTKRVIDKMILQKKGSIINIGSMAGVVGPTYNNYEGLDMPSTVAYYAEKAGLINMSRWLAATYGQYNIRCNTVSPGGFFTEKLNPVFVERYNNCTFLGRMANEDDIKGLVVYLASDASAYVTGENIMLDGGYVQK